MSLADEEHLPNQGLIHTCLSSSIQEIVAHLKRQSEITLLSGTFFFKMQEEGARKSRPTLIFVTQLKTERPLMILNPNETLVIEPHHHLIESASNAKHQNRDEVISRSD